jgi:hypothetical protein
MPWQPNNAIRSNEDVIRDALKAAVLRAMKQRDREALAVFRTALAAIDNAGAVPLDDSHRSGAIELSPVGAGQTDVARRSLTEHEMVDIVRHEVRDRRAAAASLAGAQPDTARQLRREADLLEALISERTTQ